MAFVAEQRLRGNAGYLTVEQLRGAGALPSDERAAFGAVAVIECLEGIPCNPCETACPRKCIAIGGNINDLPVLDTEKCTGCGVCVAGCPGLAIFIEDASVGNDQALVSVPYEYWPLPEKGGEVTCLDRQGRNVCAGTVERVVQSGKYDKTAVVTVRVPLRHIHDVRCINTASQS